MKTGLLVLILLITILLISSVFASVFSDTWKKITGQVVNDENTDLAGVTNDNLGNFLDKELSVEDVVRIFNLSSSQDIITKEKIYEFMKGIGVRDEDARLSSNCWLEYKTCFILSPEIYQNLVSKGYDFLNGTQMNAENYLEFLKIVYSDNGKADLGAFQLQMYALQNSIPNMRIAGKDIVSKNVFNKHRENLANMRLFDYVGILAGYEHSPLRDVYISEEELKQILGGNSSGDALKNTLVEWQVHSTIADNAKHIYAGYPGSRKYVDVVTYLKSNSWRVRILLRRISLKGNVSGKDISKIIDVTVSWDGVDGKTSVFEFQDFLIAIGNSIPNTFINPPFGFVIHPDDYNAMEQAYLRGEIDQNAEIEYMRKIFKPIASMIN